MQSIFDEIIVNSFREVVEKSIAEFFSGKGLSAFQQEYRDGMNEIGTFIQQRLIEFIDQELVEDPGVACLNRTHENAIFLCYPQNCIIVPKLLLDANFQNKSSQIPLESSNPNMNAVVASYTTRCSL